MLGLASVDQAEIFKSSYGTFVNFSNYKSHIPDRWPFYNTSVDEIGGEEIRSQGANIGERFSACLDSILEKGIAFLKRHNPIPDKIRPYVASQGCPVGVC